MLARPRTSMDASIGERARRPYLRSNAVAIEAAAQAPCDGPIVRLNEPGVGCVQYARLSLIHRSKAKCDARATGPKDERRHLSPDR